MVEFKPESDFENFKLDEEIKRFLDLKEKSIKTSILINEEDCNHCNAQ